MPGLVPGIHVFLFFLLRNKDVYGRDKPGHDGDRFLCSEKRGQNLEGYWPSSPGIGLRLMRRTSVGLMVLKLPVSDARDFLGNFSP